MLLLGQSSVSVGETASASAGALAVFLPELVLGAVIVAILVFRTASSAANRWAVSLGLAGATAATALLMLQVMQSFGSTNPLEPFLLTHTPLSLFFRLLTGVALTLTLGLCLLTGLPKPQQAVDFCVLLIGAAVGMMVTCGADHLLTVFLGIEMMSVPSYVLAGYFKGRRQATEASLKYVVYGAGAAGLMLYGLSLLFGLSGGGSFEAVAACLRDSLANESVMTTRGLTCLLAVVLVLSGFAYKLSAVPFHFWCPDAFTGAPAEVGGFLSVASKVAALGLLMRFTLLLAETQAVLPLGCLVGTVAAITATYGNLAAYRQTDAKRLLAYSTIAHAGYLLMGVAALLVAEPELRGDVQAAVLYYAFVYVFMNLTAFAAVAVLRQAAGGTDIGGYSGLGRRRTAGVAVGIALILAVVSLIGLPPTAGFFGKLLVFGALLKASSGSALLVGVFVIGALNTVLSVFYYLRLVRPLFVDALPDNAPRVVATGEQAGFLVLLATPLIAMFIPLGGVIHEFCRLMTQM